MAITLIIEDGSNVSGANSYISLADAETVFESFSEAWTGLDADKDIALANAAKILDRQYVWKGVRTNPDTQAMQWPRDGVLELDRDVLTNEIPVAITEAQCLIARELIANSGGFANATTASTKSVSLGQGALEIEFDEGNSTKVEATVVTSEIRALLEPYGRQRRAGGTSRVRRG